MRIRVVDLETTGDSPPEAGVVEIGWCDTGTNLAGCPTGWEVRRPESLLTKPSAKFTAITSAIHHIIEEDVANAPPWEEGWAFAMKSSGHDAIDALCAHSAKFERRFITDKLANALPWLDTYKCALRIWQDAPSHSNMSLRYWRKPEGLLRALASPAHRAGPDAYVTAFHLRDLLEAAPVEDLIKWSAEPALQVICHIGKQRGKKWRDVDIGFLYWLLDKDFDEDVLFTAQTEIERREKEHASPATDAEPAA